MRKLRLQEQFQIKKEIPLSGASLYIDDLALGTLSDRDGQFELTIPESGSYNLAISYLGMRTKNQLN